MARVFLINLSNNTNTSFFDGWTTTDSPGSSGTVDDLYDHNGDAISFLNDNTNTISTITMTQVGFLTDATGGPDCSSLTGTGTSEIGNRFHGGGANGTGIGKRFGGLDSGKTYKIEVLSAYSGVNGSGGTEGTGEWTNTGGWASRFRVTDNGGTSSYVLIDMNAQASSPSWVEVGTDLVPDGSNEILLEVREPQNGQGRINAIRLTELGGATNVEGSGAVSVAVVMAANAEATMQGSAAASVGFTSSANATVIMQGSAQFTESVSSTANAQTLLQASAGPTVAISSISNAEVIMQGSANFPISITATATSINGLPGSGAFDIGITSSANANVIMEGSASYTIEINMTGPLNEKQGSALFNVSMTGSANGGAIIFPYQRVLIKRRKVV